MASESTRAAARRLETLLRGGTTAALSDGDLLARFADLRPGDPSAEAAFEAIVDRHGAMVLRACRRISGDEHDAQEAAQAAFLVLAARAGSLGRVASVAPWLHGVATRVAAKARVAAARRRARERRGGEIAAARMLERRDGGERRAEDAETRAELHEALGLLPEKFRAPLVLCYLEGLTQQEAAEQLRWPLGTVQSRLARGRDRLRSRLASRGVAPALGPLGLAPARVPPPAPWAEATVRASVQFATTKGSEAIRAGAWPAAAGLASEVLRAMGLHQIRSTLAVTLIAAATAAAALARYGPPDPPPAVVQEPAGARPAPAPVPPPAPKPEAEAGPDRTITGVVLDDRGRPLAKAWVGSDPRPMMDTWDNPGPEDIRERPEPFRDAQGEVVPPGALGKYFEVREPGKAWRAVSPDDIQAFEPHVFNSEGSVPREEVLKTHSTYSVRVEKGGWWMAAMPNVPDAVRTDAAGRFATRFRLDRPTRLHFASADYALQATRTVTPDDAGRPVEVTLRPTRLARARLIETPRDDTKASVNWTIRAVDAAGRPGEDWLQWFLPDANDHDPDHVKRHLEVRLPFGRWRVEFRSETLHTTVDLAVPPGEGPLRFPDFVLESLAWARHIGRPAPEIEATDLDGRPVRLADHRGRAVVLAFWSRLDGLSVQAMPRLAAIRERFRDRPLTVLALHDASVADPEAYREAIAPIREGTWNGADLPFPVLLDREPHDPGGRLDGPKAGQMGSGRSADAYEVATWPSLFLIDAAGKLVGRFPIDRLEAALEDQFGIPHPRPAEPPSLAGRAEFAPPKRNVAVRGRVVGPDGRGVAGAKLMPEQAIVRAKGIATDADGGFAFEAEEITIDHFFLRVEAAGLASRMFRLDDSGVIRAPLRLGVGAVVTGRVVRDGRAVAGVEVGLNQVHRGMNEFLGWLTTRTDAEGRFRFDHAFADEDFTGFVTAGGLQDGGAAKAKPFRTGGHGSAVDLGDFAVEPGRTLAGRVAFADGKGIPPGTRILASGEDSSGTIAGPVDPATGRFRVAGLPPGEVSVVVQFPDLKTSWLPPGYRLAPAMPCVSPLSPYRMQGRLDRDVLDFTVLFEAGDAPRMTLDPGRLKDFEEAKAGPIAGVPPGSIPPR